MDLGRFCAQWSCALGFFTRAKHTWNRARRALEPATGGVGNGKCWKRRALQESAPGWSVGLGKLSCNRRGLGSARERRPAGAVKGWSGQGRCGFASVT